MATKKTEKLHSDLDEALKKAEAYDALEAQLKNVTARLTETQSALNKYKANETKANKSYQKLIDAFCEDERALEGAKKRLAKKNAENENFFPNKDLYGKYCLKDGSARAGSVEEEEEETAAPTDGINTGTSGESQSVKPAGEGANAEQDDSVNEF